MRSKSDDRLEADRYEVEDALNIAEEALFASAKRIRHCPDCDGGWVITNRLKEGHKYNYATECDCQLDHKKIWRNYLGARIRYERQEGYAPPWPDENRLSWYFYEGD